MDDLKINFGSVTIPKLFEDDSENSQVNQNSNLRQNQKTVNDQNNTVPSVSPIIVTNEVQNDLNIKGKNLFKLTNPLNSYSDFMKSTLNMS